MQARKGRQTKVFHTMPEYEGWKESLPGGSTKGWDIKYYKGLGTSTNDEAREYFANIDGNRKEFVWTGAPGPPAASRRAARRLALSL